jgi:hypothetical protein
MNPTPPRINTLGLADIVRKGGRQEEISGERKGRRGVERERKEEICRERKERRGVEREREYVEKGKRRCRAQKGRELQKPNQVETVTSC